MKEKTKSLAVSSLLNTLASGLTSNRHTRSTLKKQADREWAGLLAGMSPEKKQAVSNLRAIFVKLAEKLVSAENEQTVLLTAAYLGALIDGEVIVADESTLPAEEAGS